MAERKTIKLNVLVEMPDPGLWCSPQDGSGEPKCVAFNNGTLECEHGHVPCHKHPWSEQGGFLRPQTCHDDEATDG